MVHSSKTISAKRAIMGRSNRTIGAERDVGVARAPFGALVVTYHRNSTQGRETHSISSVQDRAQNEDNVHVSFQGKM
jgi:hypothetical protein